MVKITLCLDYDTFDELWNSHTGKVIEHAILHNKCLWWRGEEDEEDA